MELNDSNTVHITIKQGQSVIKEIVDPFAVLVNGELVNVTHNKEGIKKILDAIVENAISETEVPHDVEKTNEMRKSIERVFETESNSKPFGE